MTEKELQERMKRFAVSIVKFGEGLSENPGFRTVRNQIVRCGPSTAANYRAACRPKSTADFINKLESVLQEADETAFWLELLVRAEIVPAKRLESLRKETDEIIAILVTIVTKVKKRIGKL